MTFIPPFFDFAEQRPLIAIANLIVTVKMPERFALDAAFDVVTDEVGRSQLHREDVVSTVQLPPFDLATAQLNELCLACGGFANFKRPRLSQTRQQRGAFFTRG